ncbi:MAG: bifunctional uroporphyrinogen-III C-methyltransferase/uroporphyrinogen-III synthase, partial [Candidatus Omnitrophota bacterium]
TDRKLSSSVVLVTGHEAAGKKLSAVDWKGLAAAGTIVLYMAVENIARIVGKLFEAGKSPETPAAAIYRAGSFSQQIVNARLKELPAAIKAKGIRAPAIIIIGKTVKLGKQFNWLRKNKRILFTGLSQKRSFLKGNYFHLPLVKIVPLDNYRRFDNYLLYIRQFDWLVFASRYGVEYFFKRLNYVGLDSRFLRGMKIAAVGASTARRLRDYGIIADLAPKEESSAGLLKVFAKMDMKYKKIFLPRSNLADKGLTEGFKNLGCQVTSVVAYKNVMPAHLPDINLESFNEIMFTSPSTVRNFLKQYGRPPKAVKISCIGAVTRQQALKLRLLRKTS